METRRHVEFTKGSCAVITMDQHYHRPDRLCVPQVQWGPFVAAGILCSTQDMQPLQPCNLCWSPHHHWISHHVVDLVERAVRQSGAETEGERGGMLIAHRFPSTSTLVLSLSVTLFFTGGSERAGVTRNKIVGPDYEPPV
jgi:hypothetical protein